MSDSNAPRDKTTPPSRPIDQEAAPGEPSDPVTFQGPGLQRSTGSILNRCWAQVKSKVKQMPGGDPRLLILAGLTVIAMVMAANGDGKAALEHYPFAAGIVMKPPRRRP
ncbi:MAG: hypothetical protein F9K40_10380 [Kofleriaceae bacterium]|nr:MAG: hypothetical protein F9K40_10380 [Kofleriaceae bacterium]MBZ0235356.1 hypothetical protein [Kofleriaceae bacterium]